MEGPTPVSALIHAATMVTAGVFLVIRCSFLLFNSTVVLYFIVFIGSCTAFFAASVALFQFDMKKVIAYSTCSQLGYMFFSCGLTNFDVGLFHLVNHAFFKALLFLSSGVIIHAVLDEQDMRKVGGLHKLLPITYIMILIGSLALVGFPFLTGFYSKDLILELAIGKYNFLGNFSYGLGVIGALFTAFYSYRLINLVFYQKPIIKQYTIYAHEGDYVMLFCLLILSFLSLYFGFFFKDLFVGFGTDASLNSLYLVKYNFFETEFISSLKKNMAFVFTLLGILLSYFIIDFNTIIPAKIRNFFMYSNVLNKNIYNFIKFFALK